MRASPSLDISLSRFGWWRLALGTLVFASGASTAGWLVATGEQLGFGIALLAVVGTVMAMLLATASAMTSPMRLHWDGSNWQLALPTGPALEPVGGDLLLAIDLGFWMLLRFVAAGVDGRRRVTWLPVQRRGLEAQWHAFRCAVYAPRPVAGSL